MINGISIDPIAKVWDIERKGLLKDGRDLSRESDAVLPAKAIGVLVANQFDTGRLGKGDLLNNLDDLIYVGSKPDYQLAYAECDRFRFFLTAFRETLVSRINAFKSFLASGSQAQDIQSSLSMYSDALEAIDRLLESIHGNLEKFSAEFNAKTLGLSASIGEKHASVEEAKRQLDAQISMLEYQRNAGQISESEYQNALSKARQQGQAKSKSLSCCVSGCQESSVQGASCCVNHICHHPGCLNPSASYANPNAGEPGEAFGGWMMKIASSAADVAAGNNEAAKLRLKHMKWFCQDHEFVRGHHEYEDKKADAAAVPSNFPWGKAIAFVSAIVLIIWLA